MLGPQPNPKFLVSFIVFVAIFTRRILFCSSKCTLSCILTRSWLMCCNFCISCCILALGPRNRPHFHLRRSRHYREVVPVFVLPVSSSFTFGSFGKGLVSLISSFFRAWYWANNGILWGIIILVLFFLVNYDGKIKKKGSISSWARPTKNNKIEVWMFFSSTQSPNIIRGMNGLRSFTKFLLWGNRHFFYSYLSSPMIFLPLLYFANCFLSILSSCSGAADFDLIDPLGWVCLVRLFFDRFGFGSNFIFSFFGFSWRSTILLAPLADPLGELAWPTNMRYKISIVS